MHRLAGPLLQWWQGRTVRERRLLAAMLVLLAATALWLLVVRPATAWREAASERRALAEAAAATAGRNLDRLATPGKPAAGASREGLEPLVRRTAEGAGLAPVLAMGPDGGLGFQLASAPSGPALAWVSALETDHGLRLCRLSVVENADATVQIEGSLTAGDCVPAG
ncbi:type II secretion system protein GspM [Brevundimonas sp.]|uniref:type II secretion system protein GspM n=1 Tax=Brevundimonas sp. TaxID=1871086 RepID=UPI0035B37DC0